MLGGVRWGLGRILGGRFGFRRGFAVSMGLVRVRGDILMRGGGMFSSFGFPYIIMLGVVWEGWLWSVADYLQPRSGYCSLRGWSDEL